MSLFADANIDVVNHYAPLHYLPFIARAHSLKCKPSLIAGGFIKERHFRSKSAKSDAARGFERYAFLTLEEEPRILLAKLKGGFPHMAICVPAAIVEAHPFYLSRYNVAMTRVLRRNGQQGYLESTTNGRYFREHQIPVAKSLADKRAMLEYHYPRKTMIEVLIDGDLALPDTTNVTTFHEDDATIAREALAAVGVDWVVSVVEPSGPYNRDQKFVAEVNEFITHAIADPDWRGNGLDFDRV